MEKLKNFLNQIIKLLMRCICSKRVSLSKDFQNKKVHVPKFILWDRYYVRLLEIEESLKIIEQAIDNLPQGDFLTKVPKILKIENSECYQACENPKGELGFFVKSDGSEKPYRIKIRGPSFCNISILNHMCKDILLADLVAIVGSLDIVLGEIDR